MIKGWRLSPSWVAYYEMVKGYREIRKQQALAMTVAKWPYATQPAVMVDVDTLFPEQTRSH